LSWLDFAVNPRLLCTGQIYKEVLELDKISWWVWLLVLGLILAAYLWVTLG
jgi:hypothetical protein